eukprot:g3305.t1
MTSTCSMDFTLFFVMGLGVLFPWNAIITAVDYFDSIYPNVGIELYFSVAYTWSLLLTMVIMLIAKKSDENVKYVAIGYAVMLVILFLFLVVSEPPIWIAVLFSVLVGSGDAIAQSGLFALASETPAHGSAVMAGNGSAGLIVSILRLVTKSIYIGTGDENDALYKSSRIYFAICTVVISCSLAALYVSSKKRRSAERFVELKNVSTNPEQIATKDERVAFSREIPPGEVVNAREDESSLISDISKRLAYTAGVASEPVTSIFFVFFVTLSLFPGLIVEIESNDGLSDWFPIILITIFNLWDTVGRCMLSVTRIRRWVEAGVLKNGTSLILPSLFRAGFFPLICFAVSPRWIRSDIVTSFVVAIFGISNGFLATSSIVVGPQLFTRSEDKDFVSVVLVFTLMLGLAVGAAFGVGVEAVIKA